LRVRHRLVKTTGISSHMEIISFPVMCVCCTSLNEDKNELFNQLIN
jgi:hypothetical protein